jgi:hypothetical protein
MRGRWDRWAEAAVVLSIFSGCGGGVASPPSSDASAATDATTDGPGPARDGTTDATADRATDTQRQPEGAASDAGRSDVTIPDAGVDAEAEASCAVDAGPLDDAEVALGQAIVAAHRCPRCHGATLSGNFDGVSSPTLEGGLAYPPNLTPDPATGLGCWTNDQIENAFLNGIDNEGLPLCPPMPRFGHLTDGGEVDAGEARAVVEYLRSLPIFVNAVPSTPDCTVVDAGPQDAGSTLDAGSDSGDAAAEGAADAMLDAPDG